MQVLLCGTNYGANYLEPLWQHPGGLRLAGILSRGSERSRQLARSLSLPHYASLDAVPAGAVDAAVVAVGGGGAELAHALLGRGIPVLAEHPVEPADLEALLQKAARVGKVFHLNSHFGDLETVAPFVHHCAEMRQRSPLFFVSAHFNPRTAYSLFDILGRCLGPLEPFSVGRPAAAPEGAPAAFAALPAVLGGVAATLVCQRYVSAHDDGTATLVGHQVMAGFGGGNLFLGEAFGPSLWLTRLGAGTPPNLPWWSQLGPPAALAAGPPSGQIRARANVLALQRFAQQIAGGPVPPVQRPDHLLAVARLWKAVFEAMGPPEIGVYPS
jgi:yersiniabactin synthetase, thiazolinyl reductase component